MITLIVLAHLYAIISLWLNGSKYKNVSTYKTPDWIHVGIATAIVIGCIDIISALALLSVLLP